MPRKSKDCSSCGDNACVWLAYVPFCLDCYKALTDEDQARIGREYRERKAAERAKKRKDAKDLVAFRALAKRTADALASRDKDGLGGCTSPLERDLAALAPEVT